MCDAAVEGSCDTVERKTLKERIRIRRDREQVRVDDMTKLLDHLEAHPELEEFAELAAKY